MTQQNPMQNRQAAPNRPAVDEFEIMRQRLRRRGAVSGQERQRELSRQFAAFGNLPSGAALKARQQTAQAQERATNEALQDVNIAQAQTLRAERESAAGRDLQRELQQAQLGAQRDLQKEQISFQEREGAAARAAQMELANLAATTDLEKARMAGANALELQELQNEAALKAAELQEKGMNERLATRIASNRDLFDIEMAFKREGRTIEQELAREGLDLQQQEMKLNQTVTALNSLDLLFSVGFDNGEINSIVDALDLPFKDKLAGFLEDRYQRLDARAEASPSQNVAPGGGDRTPWWAIPGLTAR